MIPGSTERQLYPKRDGCLGRSGESGSLSGDQVVISRNRAVILDFSEKFIPAADINSEGPGPGIKKMLLFVDGATNEAVFDTIKHMILIIFI